MNFDRLKRFGDRWFERRLDAVVGLRFPDSERALWYALKQTYPHDARLMIRKVRATMKGDAYCRALEINAYYETGARAALVLLDSWDRNYRNLDILEVIHRVAPGLPPDREGTLPPE